MITLTPDVVVPSPAFADLPAPTHLSAPAKRPSPFPRRAEPMIWGKGRFKIDMLLSDADRPAYDAVLADPRTTANRAWAWLRERGYAVGYSAVCSHKRHADQDREQLRRAARAAAAYATAADALGGPEAFGSAALTKINELAMGHLFPEDGQSAAVTTAVLNELARTIDKAIAARARLEALRPKLAETRRERAGATIKASNREVVERVRQLLGMPPLSEDEHRPPPRVLPPLGEES